MKNQTPFRFSEHCSNHPAARRGSLALSLRGVRSASNREIHLEQLRTFLISHGNRDSNLTPPFSDTRSPRRALPEYFRLHGVFALRVVPPVVPSIVASCFRPNSASVTSWFRSVAPTPTGRFPASGNPLSDPRARSTGELHSLAGGPRTNVILV